MSANVPDLSAFQNDSDLDKIKDLVTWIALEEAALLDIKKKYESRKEELASAKEQVALLFKSKGIRGHKLDNGLSPLRSITTKFYLKGEIGQEQICMWFEENGLGANVKRSVNFQTMQSVLSARVDAGESVPVELVDFSERDSLRMNGKSAFLKDSKINLTIPEIKVVKGRVEVK